MNSRSDHYIKEEVHYVPESTSVIAIPCTLPGDNNLLAIPSQRE